MPLQVISASNRWLFLLRPAAWENKRNSAARALRRSCCTVSLSLSLSLSRRWKTLLFVFSHILKQLCVVAGLLLLWPKARTNNAALLLGKPASDRSLYAISPSTWTAMSFHHAFVWAWQCSKNLKNCCSRSIKRLICFSETQSKHDLPISAAKKETFMREPQDRLLSHMCLGNLSEDQRKNKKNWIFKKETIYPL